MSSASSSVCRSVRRGTGRVEHTSTSGREGKKRCGLGKSRYCRMGGAARTARDNRLEVDDCVGECGAVEGLAGYFECREKEWLGHQRKVFVL